MSEYKESLEDSVDFIQWTGDNLDDIREVLPEHTVTPDGTSLILNGDTDHEVPMDHYIAYTGWHEVRGVSKDESCEGAKGL